MILINTEQQAVENSWLWGGEVLLMHDFNN